MKTLSDSLQTAYKKMQLQESEIGERTVQKVLRLYGYPNASNQKYVCCVSEDPRIDIHSYSIAGRFFVMCLITGTDRKVIKSALWSVPSNMIDNLSYKVFAHCKDVTQIDKVLNDLSSGTKLIMSY